MERKISRPVALAGTALLAVAAYWLRLNQLSTAYDASGQIVAGAGNSFFTYFTLAVVAALAVYGLCLTTDGSAKAITGTPLAAVPTCLAALALVGGSAAAFLHPSREMDQLLAVLGLAAAFSWLFQAAADFRGASPHPAAFFLPVIYGGVRLVRDFRLWSRDPVILDYCYSLLALIFTMCALLELGGFAFSRGRRRLCAFFCLGAVFFSAAALSGAAIRDAAVTVAALVYLLGRAAVLLRRPQ